MSTTASNLEIMRSIYRDSAKGDVSFVERYFAPDCVIHEPPGLPYGGNYHGPQGFIEVFTKLMETWSSFNYVPDEFIADGDFVIALVTASGTSRKTGRSSTFPIAECWRFAAGKIVEVRPFYWDTHALYLLL